jgi:HK97 family phage prohead protease
MTVKHATYSLAGPASDPRVPAISVSVDDKKTGEFTAIVSVFGNTDYQGDVVMPGSFKRSLEKLRANGEVIPVVWSHDWSDPFANVGFAWPANCRETRPGEFPQAPDGGLLVKGRFDIDKPFARQVYELVRDRRVVSWSFAYDTIKERRRSDGTNELLVLDILECGPTLKGANEMATTIEVKDRIDVKPRRSSRDEKVREMQRLTNLVAYRAPAVRGLVDEVRRAAKAVVADPDADVADVRDVVTHVVTRHVTLQRYAEEDRAVARKWQGYAATRAVEELVADLAAGEKGQGRHESVSFDETNAILVREHLRQRHPRVTPATPDSTDVRTLNQLHKLDHGGGVPTGGKTDEATTKVIDQLIAEAKADKAARQKFEDANRNLLNGPIDWAAQDAYDRARAAREQQELQQKWNERAQLADERDRAEASARSQAMTPMGAYWSNTDVQDVQDGPRERVTPRITDATVPDEGTTFRMPVSGTPDPTPLRVEPDDAVREAAPESGDTYRVIPFAVTDSPQTVPQEQERFSMPILTREDSQPVLQEQPVPEVPEIGESFRLPAGGEVTETPKDGEQV